MRYKAFHIPTHTRKRYALQLLIGDHNVNSKIFHSVRDIERYGKETAGEASEGKFISGSLNFDEDDLNSITFLSSKSQATEYHYLIIREDRPEFNIDVFAVAFFINITQYNIVKSLDIKDEVNDIVFKLLLSTDIR